MAINTKESMSETSRERKPAMVKLSQIFVPHRQRVEKPNAKRMAKRWDPAMRDIPLLNERPPTPDELADQSETPWKVTDPKYALTDGLQRTTAMHYLGITEGLYGIIKISEEDEGVVYHDKDKDKTKMSRADTYGSRVAEEHLEYVLMDEIIRKNGFYVPRRHASPDPEDIKIKTVTGVEDVFKTDKTGVVLNRTLELIANCWYGDINAADQDVTRGVGRVVRDYGNQINDATVKRWRRISIPTLKAAAKPGTSQSERSANVAKVLGDTGCIKRKSGSRY